jgi:hypothetical protein
MEGEFASGLGAILTLELHLYLRSGNAAELPPRRPRR